MPKPASKNPWYVLATIHGEQTGDGWNEEIAAKNRRTWNGWSCGHLPETERAELAQLTRLDEAALLPWSKTEREDVENAFATGRGMGMSLPDPKAAIDFSDTHFATPLSMAQFVFNQAAVFTSSTFDEYAGFDSATFRDHAWFGRATFSGDAGFGSPRFSRYAWFDSATVRGDARFSSANVGGDAVFNCATFERLANFTGANFEKLASFSDCQFGRTTSFREARFQNSYPRLSGAVLHQNTTFTAADRFWPAAGNAEPEPSRDSLAIIRHAIAKQGLPEDAHYFFRREMRFRAKIGTIFERLPYILYQEFSDFGNSIIRPTFGLIAVWLSFGLLYWPGYYGKMTFQAMLAAFGLSFANIFGFLGFHGRFIPAAFDNSPAWLIAASGFQSVFGFVLLFFLGLGLRARFRLQWGSSWFKGDISGAPL